MKASLKNIKPTTKGFEITFLVGKDDYIPIAEAEEYELWLTEYRPKGTRKQMNYFYTKLRELANMVHISLTEAYQQILVDYGSFTESGVKGLSEMTTAEMNRMIEGVEYEIKNLQK